MFESLDEKIKTITTNAVSSLEAELQEALDRVTKSSKPSFDMEMKDLSPRETFLIGRMLKLWKEVKEWRKIARMDATARKQRMKQHSKETPKKNTKGFHNRDGKYIPPTGRRQHADAQPPKDQI